MVRMRTNIQMKQKADNKIIYPELSYKIVGLLFEVHNKIGGGHKEKYIQNAIESSLIANDLSYKRELSCPLIFNGKEIGRYFVDFLVENKIVLEIKVGERFKKEYINQVFSYLKTNNLKLGIIANFTREKLRFRRVLNIR